VPCYRTRYQLVERFRQPWGFVDLANNSGPLGAVGASVE
jgi:hypothetical protein